MKDRNPEIAAFINKFSYPQADKDILIERSQKIYALGLTLLENPEEREEHTWKTFNDTVLSSFAARDAAGLPCDEVTMPAENVEIPKDLLDLRDKIRKQNISRDINSNKTTFIKL